MAFLTEPEPERGKADHILPGIRRIVASNAGVMTYHGTNTYLVDGPSGTILVDPGPDEDAHIEAVLAATGGEITKIFLTHTHRDHLGALGRLRHATGAAVFAYRRSPDPDFVADHPLENGDEMDGWIAIHTPGHAPDHLCLAGTGGIVFTGDHVMSFSSSVVSPPLGDMADYFRSLGAMLDRKDHVYLPGHGPLLRNPQPYVRALLSHRQAREVEIVSALAWGMHDPVDMAKMLYGKHDPTLQRASERNVLAHLLKLEKEGSVRQEDGVWYPSR